MVSWAPQLGLDKPTRFRVHRLRLPCCASWFGTLTATREAEGPAYWGVMASDLDLTSALGTSGSSLCALPLKLKHGAQLPLGAWPQSLGEST